MHRENKATIHPELRVGKWLFRRLIQFETEETPSFFSADAHIRRHPVGRVAATNYDGILALGDLYGKRYAEHRLTGVYALES